MRAYKYRIYPNSHERAVIEKHFGCKRHVHNWGLAKKDRAYKETGKSLSRRELQDRLVADKKGDKPWLAEVNSQSLLAALANLERAYANFFAGRAGYPRFKKKQAGWQSFQCPQHVRVHFDTGRIDLPKLKGLKVKLHRRFDGTIKTVTIKRSPAGHYTASVLVDDGAADPAPAVVEADKTIGLDMGLSHYLIDSNGMKTDNPQYQKQGLDRLAVEQKKLARKQRGSGQRRRQRRRVAQVHARVARQRLDFIHQRTARLADKNHATSVAVEDLHIKGMVKNRRLARAIQDAGWGLFLTVLSYKCARQGKNVLRIGRFAPSSKRCNHCGHVVQSLPLPIRAWDCPACATHHDRDINAARNIRDFALADALGYSVCVKGSPTPIPVSAGGVAKGAETFRHGSHEAPTRAASAV